MGVDRPEQVGGGLRCRRECDRLARRQQSGVGTGFARREVTQPGRGELPRGPLRVASRRHRQAAGRQGDDEQGGDGTEQHPQSPVPASLHPQGSLLGASFVLVVGDGRFEEVLLVC